MGEGKGEGEGCVVLLMNSLVKAGDCHSEKPCGIDRRA